MAIVKASELESVFTKQDIIDAFCDKLMETIKVKNKEGYRKTVFYACGGYFDTHTKKFTHKDNGGQYYRWDDYEDEIAELFRFAGYTIKPTGYIGGVWQLSKDIMW